MQLSKEELQNLNEFQQLSKDIIFALGEIELQKTSLIDRYREVTSKQEELGNELNKKYEVPKNFSKIYELKINKIKIYEIYKLNS